MEIEQYDCPHCGTKGVIKTGDNLCPNCKQILTGENKVNRKEAITEQKREINNVHQQKTWGRKPFLNSTYCKVFFGLILLLGFLF